MIRSSAGLWSGSMAERPSSVAVVFRAAQSRRGRMLRMKRALKAWGEDSSCASRKCNGKEALLVLQVLTAQVRKLVVRSFIVSVCLSGD